MALEIRRPVAQLQGIVADRRLYLSRDGEKVVDEGDAAAASLLATPGWVIPADDCARLGLSLKDGKVVQGDNPAVVAVGESSEVAPKAEKSKRKKAE